MLTGQLALVVAAIFAGAAVHAVRTMLNFIATAIVQWASPDHDS